MIRETFKLKRDNSPHDGGMFISEKERWETYQMMYDDFLKYFPWIDIRAMGNGFNISFWSKYWDVESQTIMVRRVPVNPLDLEIAYTMLKLAGADVERYGFIEVHSSGKVNSIED